MTVYAVNIHTGGGKVLLDALLLDQPFGPVTKVYADERYSLPESMPSAVEIIAVKPKLFPRLLAEIKMYLDPRYNQTNEVLFFGNLPPLFRFFFKKNKKKKIILYLQNAFLIVDFNTPKSSLKEYLRLFVEKLWLYVFQFNVDEIWVQTEWMKQKTADALNFHKPISIKPFLPKLPDLAKPETPKYKFLYVGSLARHKNLNIFLEALKKLDQTLRSPLEVCVILDSSIKVEITSAHLNLKNIKPKTLSSLTRNDLFKIYVDSEFLVCTSSLESYYLPIYEAHHFGCTIILPSELSYSRHLPETMKTQTYKPFNLDLTKFC